MEMAQIAIEKGNRRTITIQIQPNGSVVVKAPRFTPTFLIHQFVRQHADWIEKHTQKLAAHPKRPIRQYRDGEEFLYLGTPHTLRIGQYKQIEIRDGILGFPEFLRFRITKELHDWYRKQAERIITERVQANAVKMGVTYADIYFSDTKSKWGSCSPDNRLQFNVRLIMAPLLVINYVVIHELVHTTEKNHSRAFWRKVALYTPSYRQHIKWLKEHGPELMTAF